MGTVVVISKELPEIWLEYLLLYPPVEINKARPVLINDLAGADKPVLHIIVCRSRAGMIRSMVVYLI